MTKQDFQDLYGNLGIVSFIKPEISQDKLTGKVSIELGTISDLANAVISPQILSDGYISGELKSANFKTGETGWLLTPTSAEFNVGLSTDSLDIPDTTTANSFHVDTDGNSWWGATALGTGLAWIKKDGTAKFSKSITIGGADTDYQISWDESELTVNKSTLRFQNIFGVGSDGDVEISANTTLTKDMFYDNLTVKAGYTLNGGGYRIHVKNTLTIEATAIITRSGGDGNNGSNGETLYGGGPGRAGGAGGGVVSALADGSIKGALGSPASGAGGQGAESAAAGYQSGTGGTAGNNGTGQAKCIPDIDGINGKAGGDGGIAGHGGAGGAGGTKGSKSGTIYNNPKGTVSSAYLLIDFLPAQDSLRTSPSHGSSGGGGGGGAYAIVGEYAAGGGGGGAGSPGAPGGILWIAARTIVNSGSILAKGGDGGAGGNGGDGYPDTSSGGGGGGGGGGGNGGHGGVLIMLYSKLTNGGTISANGGSIGAGGTGGLGRSGGGLFPAYDGDDGTDGTVGTDGELLQFEI